MLRFGIEVPSLAMTVKWSQGGKEDQPRLSIVQCDSVRGWIGLPRPVRALFVP